MFQSTEAGVEMEVTDRQTQGGVEGMRAQEMSFFSQHWGRLYPWAVLCWALGINRQEPLTCFRALGIQGDFGHDNELKP
jgi:hypothetical protein